MNTIRRQLHVPDGTNPDAADACVKHEQIIKSLGGIDLQLLGLGNNGHIGFNEPGAAFEKETHLVDLAESTIRANARFFTSIDEVPKQAYTMGIRTIMQAKKILVVVSGREQSRYRLTRVLRTGDAGSAGHPSCDASGCDGCLR